ALAGAHAIVTPGQDGLEHAAADRERLVGDLEPVRIQPGVDVADLQARADDGAVGDQTADEPSKRRAYLERPDRTEQRTGWNDLADPRLPPDRPVGRSAQHALLSAARDDAGYGRVRRGGAGPEHSPEPRAAHRLDDRVAVDADDEPRPESDDEWRIVDRGVQRALGEPRVDDDVGPKSGKPGRDDDRHEVGARQRGRVLEVRQDGANSLDLDRLLEHRDREGNRAAN